MYQKIIIKKKTILFNIFMGSRKREKERETEKEMKHIANIDILLTKLFLYGWNYFNNDSYRIRI